MVKRKALQANDAISMACHEVVAKKKQAHLVSYLM